MGISKIGNLFAANVDSLGASKQKGQAQESAAQLPSQSAAAASTEAAVLSPTFGKPGSQQGAIGSSDTSRQDRVAQLKAQVASGAYTPSSKDIAVAVVRDIG